MSSGYERVALDNTEQARAKTVFEQRRDWLLRKFWATVWVAFALFVARTVDLWEVIVLGHTVGSPEYHLHRGYFKLGLFCFGMWVVVAAYLVIWVKYVLKVEEEWEDYSPRAIPFATLCGLVGIISFIISFWPVWGFLTLPIVFVFFMGMLHLAHFVPL